MKDVSLRDVNFCTSLADVCCSIQSHADDIQISTSQSHPTIDGGCCTVRTRRVQRRQWPPGVSAWVVRLHRAQKPACTCMTHSDGSLRTPDNPAQAWYRCPAASMRADAWPAHLTPSQPPMATRWPLAVVQAWAPRFWAMGATSLQCPSRASKRST